MALDKMLKELKHLTANGGTKGKSQGITLIEISHLGSVHACEKVC